MASVLGAVCLSSLCSASVKGETHWATQLLGVNGRKWRITLPTRAKFQHHPPLPPLPSVVVVKLMAKLLSRWILRRAEEARRAAGTVKTSCLQPSVLFCSLCVYPLPVLMPSWLCSARRAGQLMLKWCAASRSACLSEAHAHPYTHLHTLNTPTQTHIFRCSVQCLNNKKGKKIPPPPPWNLMVPFCGGVIMGVVCLLSKTSSKYRVACAMFYLFFPFSLPLKCLLKIALTKEDACEILEGHKSRWWHRWWFRDAF